MLVLARAVGLNVTLMGQTATVFATEFFIGVG